MSTISSPDLKLAPHGGTLEVSLLGLVDFDAMLGLQEQQIYELSGRDDASGMLFLCEHPPTISMGREASWIDLLVDEDDLRKREIPVRWVSRGGGAIVHAPGQLGIYLQLPLDRLGIGLRSYREQFEQAVLSCCREMRIPAKRQPDATGIWTRGGRIACFGGSVKSWISCQGMFLNVSIDRRFLDMAQTGPAGARSTSMQSQRLDPVRMPQVRESLIRHISESFGYQLADVSTGHPLLRRTRKKMSVPA